jgi:hypothetical protein
MEPRGKESREKGAARRAYVPPRLREYGSLARIVQAKPGAQHDSLSCAATKDPP